MHQGKDDNNLGVLLLRAYLHFNLKHQKITKVEFEYWLQVGVISLMPLKAHVKVMFNLWIRSSLKTHT